MQKQVACKALQESRGKPDRHCCLEIRHVYISPASVETMGHLSAVWYLS